MTIYSLYIYDRLCSTPSDPHTLLTHILSLRHCSCVYYQDWHRSKTLKAANEGMMLPGVAYQVLSHNEQAAIGTQRPRSDLSLSSGIVVAVNDEVPAAPAPVNTGLPFDEESKLVYGVVLSLRNMIRKLSGKYVHPRPIRLCLSRDAAVSPPRRAPQGRAVRQLPHLDVQAASVRDALGLQVRDAQRPARGLAALHPAPDLFGAVPGVRRAQPDHGHGLARARHRQRVLPHEHGSHGQGAQCVSIKMHDIWIYDMRHATEMAANLPKYV